MHWRNKARFTKPLAVCATSSRTTSSRWWLKEDRKGYLHVARGEVRINDHTLKTGDAMKITGYASMPIVAEKPGELLFFDMA
jgi:hypothetical protein